MVGALGKDWALCARGLHGPAASVFAFASAFPHLSVAYDSNHKDPFRNLSHDERVDILQYLSGYQGTVLDDEASFADISTYFPDVYEKVSENLEWYLKRLEGNENV
jgi:hypothetical protein